MEDHDDRDPSVAHTESAGQGPDARDAGSDDASRADGAGDDRFGRASRRLDDDADDPEEVDHTDDRVVVDDLDAPARRVSVRMVAVVLALLAGSLMVLLAIGIDRDQANVRVGELVPAISGSTLDGGTFDLEAVLRDGRWVVINFFATWCPPCIEEHPELIEFDERHDRPGGAQVVSVVWDEPPEVVRGFFDRNGGDWPVLIDTDGRIAVDLAVLSVPETFLVAPSGAIVASFRGGVTADGLESTIRSLGGSLQAPG